MNIHALITTDPDILSGQPVFTGTRVPIETLFDHLEAGVSLGEFLDDFPAVTLEAAIQYWRDRVVDELEARNEAA